VLTIAGLSNEPAFRIRKRVSEVLMTVVAEDAQGRPIRGLSGSQLAVREDGQPVEQFVLRPAVDLPLRVGIVLDLSGSTALTWEQVRRALVESVQQLVRPEDQVLVVTFDRKIELEQTLAKPMELQTLLPAKDTGGLTALYDSLYQTCDDHDFFADGQPRRLALILFSDGEDNLSLRGLRETIARAQKSGIAFYTVAMHRRKAARAGDAILQQMAEDTGGQAFVVKDGRELQTALAAINDELRSGYLLNFHPLTDDGTPSFHRVEVAPTAGLPIRVRARSGYYTAP
jgi:VWFA-related protein